MVKIKIKTMNRNEFLKKLGIGLGVAVVAPKMLATIPEKEEIKPLLEEKDTFKTPQEVLDEYKQTGMVNFNDIQVGIFYNGEEVHYRGYKRVPTFIYQEGLVIKPFKVVSPITPLDAGIVEFDEVRIFKGNECIVKSPLYNIYRVIHGTWEVQW